MKIAVTLLFTYIGVPCVYYGDEVGMEGGHDPDCRRTFPWDEEWDEGLLEHYKHLIALRRERKVLQEGAFLPLHAEKDAYAFARLLEDEIVVVAVNRGEAKMVELPVWKLGLQDGTLASLFGADVEVAKGEVRLELSAKTNIVLLKP